jgi:uncharacterized protein (DUF2267 family)
MPGKATKMHVFESAVADGHQWINEIDAELGVRDEHFALQLLRGVLHALRDRLGIDQTAHLSAQLPLLIRGLYYENWDPQPFPDHERSLDDFIDRVRPAIVGYDPYALEDDVGAVFRVLQRHVSFGEGEKIAQSLPREIAELWNANIA